ncbi:MAG TPA: hypothetical protein VFC90_07945 [Planctomycetota bacterium]|nr:hypothetical protein [Planctomycetota bacterium]
MAKSKSRESGPPKDYDPMFRRIGDAIARLGVDTPAVVSVEFTDKADPPFHYLMRGGSAGMKAGRPPEGLAKLLEVRIDSGRLRAAVSKARAPQEILVESGMKVRGSVAFANQLLPHLVRVFAEAKAELKGRKKS